MCLFKRKLSLSLPFSFSPFFQVPIYLNSFPPFLLSPSLISKPQSLYAAGAQLCVFDCVCVRIRVFVWVFLAHRCHSEHSTLYTKDLSNKKKKKEKGETGGVEGSVGTLKADVLVLYRAEGLGLLDRAYFNGRCIGALG